MHTVITRHRIQYTLATNALNDVGPTIKSLKRVIPTNFGCKKKNDVEALCLYSLILKKRLHTLQGPTFPVVFDAGITVNNGRLGLRTGEYRRDVPTLTSRVI